MPEKYIEKIHCKNFKGFRDRKLEDLNGTLNIVIGDNDTGKSSILLAIELVLSANPHRVEAIGLDRLLNQAAVKEFLEKEERKFEDLPELEIDLYLHADGQPEFDGPHNIEQTNAYGIYLRCRPRDELHDLINEVITAEQPTFPYEYYMVEIKGFSGEPITPYKKPLDHLLIDNTRISNEHASRSYIKKVYDSHTEGSEKHQLKYQYRQAKSEFSNEHFRALNERVEGDYRFSVKSSSKANLETDLTIEREGIDIENLGAGAQCFIRTEFALSKPNNIDIVLLEEPENHLSHENMKRLVKVISEATQSQVFIATHSSLICSRLDLRHTILFGSPEADPTKLDKLTEETAQFFMKAPNSSVLEFVLSERNLLVEGNAEYILMDALYHGVTDEALTGSGINVISMGGLSAPRFLEIAQLLGNKTAVITDNDGDGQRSCVARYEAFDKAENIAVFFDDDDTRNTFEICLYQDNKEICEELFAAGRKTLTVQQYMLKNKAEAAFQLAAKKAEEITPPAYISEAIKWISA